MKRLIFVTGSSWIVFPNFCYFVSFLAVFPNTELFFLDWNILPMDRQIDADFLRNKLLFDK